MDYDEDLISKNVGEGIKKARINANLTQAQLGQFFNISHQQINKYESGENRISAVRLFQIANVLKTDIRKLFNISENGMSDNEQADFTYSLPQDDEIRLSRLLEKISPEKRSDFVSTIERFSESFR